jgi:CheY-like chemotaxis protein
MLEWAGHQVVEAATGAAARARLADDAAAPRPDVVLLDLSLPDVSGWDLLADLRARGLLAELRVVVFSAHIGPREYARAAAEGAYAYLTKPFDEEELLAVVTG